MLAVAMRVLVTGATGFLGSAIARQLVARGDEVRVLLRATSDRRRLAGLAAEEAIGDVTDRAAVERALAGVDRVIHSAAVYELGTRRPDEMRRTNVEGARHVLEAAAARGVPAVHVSSVVALGPTRPGAPAADEGHWAGDAARSAYEETKRAAHEAARALAAAGADVRIAAPVTIYGPDDPSLVGRFHRAYVHGWVRVGALAGHRMTLVHVDDCADGVVRLSDAGRAGDEVILGAQVVTFRSWMQALSRASGRPVPRVWLPDAWLGPARWAAPLHPLLREGLAMGLDWAYSGDRARERLGWSPRPLERGLASVVDWARTRRA